MATIELTTRQCERLLGLFPFEDGLGLAEEASVLRKYGHYVSAEEVEALFEDDEDVKRQLRDVVYRENAPAKADKMYCRVCSDLGYVVELETRDGLWFCPRSDENGEIAYNYNGDWAIPLDEVDPDAKVWPPEDDGTRYCDVCANEGYSVVLGRVDGVWHCPRAKVLQVNSVMEDSEAITGSELGDDLTEWFPKDE